LQARPSLPILANLPEFKRLAVTLELDIKKKQPTTVRKQHDMEHDMQQEMKMALAPAGDFIISFLVRALQIQHVFRIL
jgi:hypothetical protein